MKKWLILAALSLLFSGCENKKGAFLERVTSHHYQQSTVQRLIDTIKAKGLTHFGTIDHSDNAKKVGIALKPESVVLFGNPKMGTVLMQCNPSMGLDLPLRILVTTDYKGETTLTYTNPEYWTLKHNIKDKKCLGIIQKVHIAMQKIVDAVAN